jgi:hypothetical protein
MALHDWPDDSLDHETRPDVPLSGKIMSGTPTLQAFWHDMTGLYATRMADSPAHGVIDANLKVLRKSGSFGADTEHIAGSNMPGHGRLANLTITIVRLSLRPADHRAEKRPGAFKPGAVSYTE